MSVLHVHEHPEATEHHNTGPHAECNCRVCVLQRKVQELENKVENLDNALLEAYENE